MTLTATWLSQEGNDPLRLWMAADSRISDRAGTLIDDGVKLFELPVLYRRMPGTPDASGEPQAPVPFGAPMLDTSLGLVCAGPTLIFQQVYATLVPLLGNVMCTAIRIPPLHEQAEYVARLLTHYTRSLGELRPQSASSISMIVGGVDSLSRQPAAYELRADADRDDRIRYRAEKLALSPGHVEFRGSADAVSRASEMWAGRSGESWERTEVMSILQTISEDGDFPSVGGGRQLGYTHGWHFRRVAYPGPRVVGEADMTVKLNNVDIFELGGFGEWPVFPPTIA